MAQLPPDLKKLQKISFGLLGGAVVLSVGYLWRGKDWGVYGSAMLGVAYALMFTALYLDFARIRPALKAIREGRPVPNAGKVGTTAKGKTESKKSIEDKTGAGTGDGD